ncbi:MAG: beta-aspartyl-dipeptidase (metallo-type), partial [Candidatus Paceibacteria bacterium]
TNRASEPFIGASNAAEPSMIKILRTAEVFIPKPVGRQSLIIGAGKVLWMGVEIPKVEASLVEEEVDLKGARSVPLLVDCHAHTCGGEAGAETRVPALLLSSFTRAGVTSVVGLLGTDGETPSMQE